MDSSFATAYKNLNARQKQAVDTTEGAVLVLAGPGTGKTQLLGMRAANIVRQGAVSANNILCLTYTETGASEMRERITKIMGVNGADVAIHTFHSFGTWLINQYPEYFASVKALSPLDDLGRFHVLETILSKLPLRHPLAVRGEGEHFVRQHAVAEAIRAFKQAGLTPDDLRSTLKENDTTLKNLQPLLDTIFGSTLSKKRLPEITAAVAKYQMHASTTLGAILLETLLTAIDESEAVGKTAPLGNWRTEHTTIKQGTRVFKSAATAKLLHDTIDLYEQYQKQLKEFGRFDYEDMVLWAAEALDQDADMRADVAERYQYVMVDEYQDTNGAQNRLLNAVLSANTIDTPNILVVGDDDQAIMRFQGAEVSGTLQFIETYHPEVIVLEDNYRSTQTILDLARSVITQTDERLEAAMPELGITKILTAHNDQKTILEHIGYNSPTAQYGDVARRISALVKQGTPAHEIAVIGRKHAELKLVVPFIQQAGLTVAYDGRDSILDAPALQQLIELAALIEVLASRPSRAGNLLPQVLAAPYWNIPPLDLYRVAAHAREEGKSWLATMLASENTALNDIAEWLIAAATSSKIRNFTQMFDVLIGRAELADTTLHSSPYKTYLENTSPEAYATLLSNLIRLRAAVLQSRPTAQGLADMLAVVEDYRRSGTRLVDDNPVLRGDASGVQLMSAHGAKGREFAHVFVLSAVDNVWGPRARSNNQRIRLPENLPLYPAGDTTADKLRLLYVAMTRAKQALTLTSYQQTDEGKAVTALSYLQDTVLAEPIIKATAADERLNLLETAWSPAPAPTNRSLHNVLEPLLRDFSLSPSSLRTFLDIRYNGPVAAIESHVLRFPAAYNASSALGSAVHHALNLAHKAFNAGKPLSNQKLLEAFDEKLNSSGLSEAELENVKLHGHQFLPDFITKFTASDFASITSTEEFLKATLPGGIQLTGALDALKQDGDKLTVIDYKTGTPPPPEWKTTGLTDSKKVSLHFYRQQLMAYKLLVENSKTYKGNQSVHVAELVFVEPDSTTGEYCRLDITTWSKDELERTRKLMEVVYARIKNVDLPDVSSYSKDLKGVLQFEEDLLRDAI